LDNYSGKEGSKGGYADVKTQGYKGKYPK